MPTTISVKSPSFNQVVDIDVVPFITFSAGVNSGSIVFNIKDGGNNIVPTTPSYNSGIFTYTIVPNNSLNYNQGYTANFVSGVDLSAAQISPSSWPFSTLNYTRNNNVFCWYDIG